MTDDEFLARCTPAEVIYVPTPPGRQPFNCESVMTSADDGLTTIEPRDPWSTIPHRVQPRSTEMPPGKP